MDDLRERKLRTNNESSKSEPIPRIHLTRQTKSHPLFTRLLGKTLLTTLIGITSLFLIYTYISSNDLNSIFFRYGLPTESAWKLNDQLSNHTSRIDIKLHGPEVIALGPNGSVFTGLSNGMIVRIDLDQHVEKIIQIGGELDERVCDLVRSGHVAEPHCGRPFGMRFKPNTDFLYVADSFYGIIKIDVVKKTKTILLAANDARFGSKPLRSPEDIDIDGDNIYFVDSSYKHDINEAFKDIVHLFAGGRLFRYNEKLDKLDLLGDQFYYPNGVQLSPNRDAIFVNELSMARIMKFHLTGSNTGRREVFVELPGLSDAIRLTDHKTLLVPFVAVFPSTPSIMGFFGRYSIIRSIYGYFLEPNQVMKMWPKYGLVAEYDLGGKVLKTWHDTTGLKVSHVTNAVLNGNKLYLGSFSNDFITVANYN